MGLNGLDISGKSRARGSAEIHYIFLHSQFAHFNTQFLTIVLGYEFEINITEISYDNGHIFHENDMDNTMRHMDSRRSNEVEISLRQKFKAKNLPIEVGNVIGLDIILIGRGR